mmetsp:Transcript_2623/g.8149  ORF Transcript_2623/g.8149 Transcript_2623/m.8149 type:complete len:219 (+) Transcript_2623:252-908(+)
MVSWSSGLRSRYSLSIRFSMFTFTSCTVGVKVDCCSTLITSATSTWNLTDLRDLHTRTMAACTANLRSSTTRWAASAWSLAALPAATVAAAPGGAVSRAAWALIFCAGAVKASFITYSVLSPGAAAPCTTNLTSFSRSSTARGRTRVSGATPHQRPTLAGVSGPGASCGIAYCGARSRHACWKLTVMSWRRFVKVGRSTALAWPCSHTRRRRSPPLLR